MTDHVFVRDLSCQAIIGMLPEERKTPQTLIINLEVATDTTTAAFTKDLSQTVDYALIANEVQELARDAEAHLLETLAEDIAKYVLSHPPAFAVTVALDKPDAVAEAATVGVSIYRER